MQKQDICSKLCGIYNLTNLVWGQKSLLKKGSFGERSQIMTPFHPKKLRGVQREGARYRRLNGGNLPKEVSGRKRATSDDAPQSLAAGGGEKPPTRFLSGISSRRRWRRRRRQPRGKSRRFWLAASVWPMLAWRRKYAFSYQINSLFFSTLYYGLQNVDPFISMFDITLPPWLLPVKTRNKCFNFFLLKYQLLAPLCGDSYRQTVWG